MGTSYWHPAGHGSVFQPTPLPLLNGTAEDGCTIIEQPAGLHTLAQRYVDRAVDFIKRQAQAAKPFVLYMPFNHVHTALKNRHSSLGSARHRCWQLISL